MKNKNFLMNLKKLKNNFMEKELFKSHHNKIMILWVFIENNIFLEFNL